VASAATNVWLEEDLRDADANESWTAFQQRTALGGNQRPEAATSRRHRAVVVLVRRSGTAQCVRRRRRNHQNSNVLAVVG